LLVGGRHGSLAILTAQHLEFFLSLAKGVCSIATAVQKDNVVASNLLSLASSEWIATDVLFINGTAKAWLNPHTKFHQSTDPAVGEPAFLSFHRQVRYLLMLEDLEELKLNWRTRTAFSQFFTKVGEMSDPNLKRLKLEMVSAFLTKMQTQQALPAHKESCTGCLFRMANGPGGCTISERRRRGNAAAFHALLLQSAWSRNGCNQALQIPKR
jgi:hypothetical protein